MHNEGEEREFGGLNMVEPADVRALASLLSISAAAATAEDNDDSDDETNKPLRTGSNKIQVFFLIKYHN